MTTMTRGFKERCRSSVLNLGSNPTERKVRFEFRFRFGLQKISGEQVWTEPNLRTFSHEDIPTATHSPNGELRHRTSADSRQPEF